MQVESCRLCDTCGKPVMLCARAASVKEVNGLYHTLSHASRFTINFFWGWRAEQGEMMRAHKRLVQMPREQWRELMHLPGSRHVDVYAYILSWVLEVNHQGPPVETQIATFYADLYNLVNMAVRQQQPVWPGAGTVMQPQYQFVPSSHPSELWLKKYLNMGRMGITNRPEIEDFKRYQNEYMRTYEARCVLYLPCVFLLCGLTLYRSRKFVTNDRDADRGTRLFRIIANLPFFLNIVTHEASWAYLHLLYRYIDLAARGKQSWGRGSGKKGSQEATNDKSQTPADDNPVSETPHNNPVSDAS